MVETYVWDGSPTPTSLESRFFSDNGQWENAPLLKGTTKFQALSDAKNIMVTGGEGFIASWLVRHLVLTYPNEYNVISFDKLDYCSSLNNTRMLDSRTNFRFFHGDVTNPLDVRRCLKLHQIDTIFHFAAQSHVDLSFGNSYSFTKNNVYGTHVLLESAKEVRIRRFIHISTDEVYGEVDKDADDLLEHSALAPTNPYAATKAAAEMMVTAYSRSYNLPVIMVRSNNVYGPHQFPEKVIPKFINLLQRRRCLIVHGDGQHSRRYIYAGDAADAFDTILHRGHFGQVYNIGSVDEVTNLELCAKLLAVFNIPQTEASDWIKHTKDRPFNDRRYAVDGTKLHQLGWEQKTTFEEGLKITADWYRDFPNWWGDITNVLTPFPVIMGESAAPGDLCVREESPVVKTTSANAMRNNPEATAMKKRKVDMVM